LLPSPSSVFFLIQQKRGERERITRNVPKEGNRCTGRGKGGGADFFLLSKLPFGYAGGGETAGATKDSGATALVAAGGAGAWARVAPVRDLVGTADRVRAEAPHRAKRGVAAPVRHGDRLGIGRFEGHGLGEEQCERCEEEDAVGTRGRASDTDARRRRHGLTSGDGWWRRGSGSATSRRTSAFLFSAFAQCRAGGETREEDRVSSGGGGGGGGEVMGLVWEEDRVSGTGCRSRTASRGVIIIGSSDGAGAGAG
jgi:hypothetical protein